MATAAIKLLCLSEWLLLVYCQWYSNQNEGFFLLEGLARLETSAGCFQMKASFI